MKVGDIVRTKKWGNVGKILAIRENLITKNYIIMVLFYRYEIFQQRKSVFVQKSLYFDESELIKANLSEILSYSLSYTGYLLTER